MKTTSQTVIEQNRRPNGRVFRNLRGFSIVELTVMISVIGVLVLFATPSLAKSWGSEQIRGAKVTFTGMHAKARAVAIQRSSPTILEINSGTAVIHSVHPVTGAADTVGAVVDFRHQFGVGIDATRDSLQFDTRGIGTESSSTTIFIVGTSRTDTLRVSRTGRFYP